MMYDMVQILLGVHLIDWIPTSLTLLAEHIYKCFGLFISIHMLGAATIRNGMLIDPPLPMSCLINYYHY